MIKFAIGLSLVGLLLITAACGSKTTDTGKSYQERSRRKQPDGLCRKSRIMSRLMGQTGFLPQKAIRPTNFSRKNHAVLANRWKQ